jgi:hypothetical protein
MIQASFAASRIGSAENGGSKNDRSVSRTRRSYPSA